MHRSFSDLTVAGCSLRFSVRRNELSILNKNQLCATMIAPDSPSNESLRMQALVRLKGKEKDVLAYLIQ